VFEHGGVGVRGAHPQGRASRARSDAVVFDCLAGVETTATGRRCPPSLTPGGGGHRPGRVGRGRGEGALARHAGHRWPSAVSFLHER